MVGRVQFAPCPPDSQVRASPEAHSSWGAGQDLTGLPQLHICMESLVRWGLCSRSSQAPDHSRSPRQARNMSCPQEATARQGGQVELEQIISSMPSAMNRSHCCVIVPKLLQQPPLSLCPLCCPQLRALLLCTCMVARTSQQVPVSRCLLFPPPEVLPQDNSPNNAKPLSA